MTLCAGTCRYHKANGYCTITLSLSLLQYRSRKELVETLLHEMIHAFLFVTQNNKDHNGHGSEFVEHMKRINSLTGANITVYHNFHAEVDNFRTHVWRCDGLCQQLSPFYGFVKRAINRKPGKSDYWYTSHKKICGGNFIKVKEPKDFGTKNKKKRIGKIKRTSGRRGIHKRIKFEEYIISVINPNYSIELIDDASSNYTFITIE